MRSSPMNRVWQIGLTVIAAIGVPAGAAATKLFNYSKNPVLSLLILIVYETLVLILGFFSSVASNLRNRWVARLTEATDGWMLRAASGVGREYRKYVIAANSYIDVKGLSTRGEFTLSLDEIFINLKLDPQSLHRLSPDPLQRPVESARSDSIWEWIYRARDHSTALVIVGPPGSGKTTLLKHVAYVLAVGGRRARLRQAPRKVPVLVPLRDHADLFRQETTSLADLIRAALIKAELTEPKDWVVSQLQKQRFLIMLDGLDEIADDSVRKKISSWIDQQQRRYSETHFLITSRPFGYRVNPLDRATVVQVQPFDEDQVKNFIVRWYGATSARSYGADNDAAQLSARIGAKELIDTITRNYHLVDLAVNPLLLTMIANVHYYRGALPGSRGELYDEVCNVFLGTRSQARGQSLEISTAQRRMVLEYLACHMMKEGKRDISYEEAVRVLKRPMSRVQASISAGDFLRIMEESSGLLLEREHHIYAFAHLSFQEYLTAAHIVKHPTTMSLADHVRDSWWHETIRLYAAQTDATTITVTCLREGRTSLDVLRLGMDCLIEGREVGAEAHELLAQIINPPDIRIDADTRRMAGAASLLHRRGDGSSNQETLHLCGGPITNMEYQAFLDDGNQDRAPDHWNEALYQAGLEFKAVTGVRLSDARDFCKWMQRISGDAWSYRLPRTRELGSEQLVSEELLSENGLSSTWTDTVVTKTYESHGLKLLISIDDLVYAFDDPWPGHAVNSSDAALRNIATHDFQKVLSRSGINWLVDFYSPDSIENTLNELRTYWTKLTGLDIDRCLYELKMTIESTCKEISRNVEQQGDQDIDFDTATYSIIKKDNAPSVDGVLSIESVLAWATNPMQDRLKSGFERRFETGPAGRRQSSRGSTRQYLLVLYIILQGQQRAQANPERQGARSKLDLLFGRKDRAYEAYTVQRELSSSGDWTPRFSNLEFILIEHLMTRRLRNWVNLVRAGLGSIVEPVSSLRRETAPIRSDKPLILELPSLRVIATGAPVREMGVYSPSERLLHAYAEMALFESQLRDAPPTGEGIFVVRERSATGGSVRIYDQVTGTEWPVPVGEELSRATIFVNEGELDVETERKETERQTDRGIEIRMKLRRNDRKDVAVRGRTRTK